MAVRSISVNQYLSHYCNSLYVSVSQSSVSQNAAARLLTRTQKKEHITHDLSSQQWPAFHFRVHYKIIFFVLKCINSVAPSYLFELLHFHSPFQLLRSADQLWMCQADRAFAVQQLPNSFPFHIRQTSSFSIFRFAFKSHSGIYIRLSSTIPKILKISH